MNETPLRFGSGEHLAGMLVQPEPALSFDNRAVVIFITAGLLHKPGPYRLYVELSRMLAATGIASLRFDLSGIGESAPRRDDHGAEMTAVCDVRDAMDAMQESLACERFVLAGLCSGAEVAHRAAVTDARVRGIVAMDGFIPRTARFYLHHYLPRMLSARKWAGFIAGVGRRLTRNAHGGVNAEDASLAFWEGAIRDRDEMARELDLLCARDVRQLQIFSGGSGDCSYARQFHDAFRDVGFRGLVDVRHFADADHMYILREDRLQLMRTVTHWLRENFSRLPAVHTPAVLHLQGRGRHTATAPLATTGNSAQIAARRNSE